MCGHISAVSSLYRLHSSSLLALSLLFPFLFFSSWINPKNLKNQKIARKKVRERSFYREIKKREIAPGFNGILRVVSLLFASFKKDSIAG